ncbi:hypothetical protein K0G60_04890 [Bacteroides fragilis]|jgi:hypothetical protein|nr:hypothetical protein [Bacteroides fragilis]
MRILVLSKEAWRDDQNGGNVLSNIFSGFHAEFAQITCAAAKPSNSLCKKYFQMTDSMMMDYCRHLGNSNTIGRVLNYEEYPKAEYDPHADVEVRGIKKWIGGETVRIAREFFWWVAPWHTKRLDDFVLAFNPDVIFAPCYGNHYMLRLTRIVHSLTRKPVISYISDDFYTNRQYRLSPLYWVNHFLLRKHVRQTITCYKLVYTMTEEQKLQCEKDFGVPMKIVCKSGVFPPEKEKTSVNNPIKFIFAGGIYLNRWKTLVHIAEAMRRINRDGIKMQLDIYTNNRLSPQQERLINDGTTSILHNGVSLEKLKEVYAASDIALHVEAFDLKSRWTVRLSFSTKIVDCLESGCATMAICDEKQAGWAYLKRNDAAICISSLPDIERVLREVLEHPERIIEYQRKAFRLGRKYHNKEQIQKEIRQDFLNVMFDNNF